MKGQTFLLLDVSNLAWRAFHVVGNLSYNGIKTGIIFQLLKDIELFQETFETKRVIFCFDRGESLRVREFPEYKKNRQAIDEEQRKARREVRKQIDLLRKEYLPDLGYANVFHQYGYEADDIIASVASHIASKQGRVVVIGGDHDLYQLLSPRISVYDPRTRKTLTHEGFLDQYGINPVGWVDVKAMAGCKTDGIPGIAGVGEKTAIKFLTGKLKSKSKAYKAIVKGNALWQRNRGLVELPFPGVKQFVIREDSITDKKWRRLAKRLGMKSMLGRKAPEPTKEYRRNITIKRRSFF